jgi:hypothetical protein
MPTLDAIVCGSVAVTRDGRRRGEGYSDLEFAILRESGHPPVPVATTVHDLQVVDAVPRDPTDQPLSVIATPTRAIRIKRPGVAPTGIDWTRLSAEVPLRACLRLLPRGTEKQRSGSIPASASAQDSWQSSCLASRSTSSAGVRRAPPGY